MRINFDTRDPEIDLTQLEMGSTPNGTHLDYGVRLRFKSFSQNDEVWFLYFEDKWSFEMLKAEAMSFKGVLSVEQPSLEFMHFLNEQNEERYKYDFSPENLANRKRLFRNGD